MTNKEAREILRTIGFHIPVAHTGIKHPRDFYEAIDLAIKALEREADLEQAVVNIKMSEEETKQFKQMLQEHTSLCPITSDNVPTVEIISNEERQQGEWIRAGSLGNCVYDILCEACGSDKDFESWIKGIENE